MENLKKNKGEHVILIVHHGSFLQWFKTFGVEVFVHFYRTFHCSTQWRMKIELLGYGHSWTRLLISSFILTVFTPHLMTQASKAHADSFLFFANSCPLSRGLRLCSIRPPSPRLSQLFYPRFPWQSLWLEVSTLIMCYHWGNSLNTVYLILVWFSFFLTNKNQDLQLDMLVKDGTAKFGAPFSLWFSICKQQEWCMDTIYMAESN